MTLLYAAGIVYALAMIVAFIALSRGDLDDDL